VHADSVSIVNVPSDLADALSRVAKSGERFVLKRHGKRMAALVPVDELEFLERLEDEADIKAARKALKQKGGITLAAYKKKHGL